MFYIPLTAATLASFTQAQTELKALVATLSAEEMAALLLLQRLPDLALKAKSDKSLLHEAERFIANFLRIYDIEPLPALQQSVLPLIDTTLLRTVKVLLDQYPLRLMTPEQLQEKAYLTEDGQWNWDFKHNALIDFAPSRLLTKYAHHTSKVSTEEERILNTILADLDEPIDVQGYAGSGKTWLISRLVEVLDKEKTAFLALTWNQVTALISRIPGAQGDTFAGIAEQLLSINLIGPVRHIKRRYKKKYVISDQKLADYLNCYEMGNHRREYIANRAWSTVTQFCYSSDAVINLEHVRKVFNSSLLSYQALLLTLAKQLWELICIPRDGIYLPLRDYHLVKALSLTGMGLPSRYTHIVVDETHNLPLPILQILQQSPQPVFTFGDYYQALEGLHKPYNTLSTLRKKTLAYSVRAGANIEGIYNKILQKHPILPEVEFAGNKTKATKLIYYQKFAAPDKYCTILVKSMWSVLAIIHKLHKQSARYYLMETAKHELKWLVNDAIAFYQTGDKPRHYDFAYVTSWQDFVDKHKAHEPALLWVDKLFSTGFEFSHLQVLLEHSITIPIGEGYPKDAYIIGRVRDCRNIEFDRVLLLDDVVKQADFMASDHAQLVSHIYTGISRAKHELYIPDSLSDWLNN